jgi:hypothetical protein
MRQMNIGGSEKDPLLQSQWQMNAKLNARSCHQS